MKLSKLLRAFLLIACVLCAFAFLGPSTIPLLAHGTVEPRLFQFGGVSALELDTLSALPGKNLGTSLNSQAINEFTRKSNLRRSQRLAQECKPPGATCSVPGDCCSNSCVPPGFGGQPTCQ